MKASFWDTPAKDIPRNVVMTQRPINSKRPRAASTALTLPGDKLLCVVRGQEAGVFNQHTRHVFVERDPDVQNRIKRLARHKLYCEWDPILWRDEIWKLPLRACLDNTPLEFAYLDFCAALNARVARWIFTELSPALADGAVLAVTLSRNWRASKYMKWWSSVSERRGTSARDEFDSIEQSVCDADCCGTVGDIFSFYDDSQTSFSSSIGLGSRGSSKWNKLLCPEYHEASVRIISAFTLLLAYHDFDLESCVEYRRSQSHGAFMTTFVLTNIRRRDTPRVSRQLLRQMGEHTLPKLRPV